MGEYAYGSLSRRDEDAFAEVFGELARKFVGFMDVLAGLSERTGVGVEQRRACGSTRSGCAPAAPGTVRSCRSRHRPNGSIGKRFIQ